MDAVASLKRLVRGVLRRGVRLAAHGVSQRPWLLRGAARVLAAFPSLKHRIRRLINAPEVASRREDSLRPDEARVLVDLRQAIADRQGGPR